MVDDFKRLVLGLAECATCAECGARHPGVRHFHYVNTVMDDDGSVKWIKTGNGNQCVACAKAKGERRRMLEAAQRGIAATHA